MKKAKMLETLLAIKALWDVAGLGDNPETSERVYKMLQDRIAELEALPQ
jgi:hypothetical protein